MISVIIATRDRATLLAATLDAIVAQASPGRPFEIIVVDNASVDATAAVTAAASARHPGIITYVFEPSSGKSHALNTALLHAHGDLLVFTDDDVLPERDWLQQYVRAFEETDAGYAAGRILPLWEAPVPAWMSPALHGVFAVPDGGPDRLMLTNGANDQVMPLGANMAVRRNVVETIGGWNPDLGKLQGTLRTGEDHEFALRMAAAGFIGVYEPRAAVRHRVPANRLRLSYVQRWFHDNGGIEARLERRFPTAARYLAGVPRHLWREFLSDLAGLAFAGLTFDRAALVARYMRLVWFAGYLRERWRRRVSSTHAGPASAVLTQG